MAKWRAPWSFIVASAVFFFLHCQPLLLKQEYLRRTNLTGEFNSYFMRYPVKKVPWRPIKNWHRYTHGNRRSSITIPLEALRVPLGHSGYPMGVDLFIYPVDAYRCFSPSHEFQCLGPHEIPNGIIWAPSNPLWNLMSLLKSPLESHGPP